MRTRPEVREILALLIVVGGLSIHSEAGDPVPRVKMPPSPGKLGFKSPEVLPDHRVIFRFYTPTAESVLVGGDFGIHSMQQGDSGVWSATLGPLESDLYTYAFSVDGSVPIPDPLNPDIATHEKGSDSLLNVSADRPLFHEPRAVPHGAVHMHWYHAKSLGELRRVLVYTPPGYEKQPDKEYPVLYLLHGGRQNETVWFSSGRVNFIMDNLVAEGKAVPMVIVAPHAYGRGGLGGRARDRNIQEFARSMIEDTIPFVESAYRVSARPEHRAVAGFSVGSAQARTIGLNNLHLFSHIGFFSGGKRFDEDWRRTSARLVADLDTVRTRLRLFWMSGPLHEPGDQPAVAASGKEDPFAEFFEEHGIDYVARPDRFGHSMRTCRWILYHDFAPRLFRQER